jgi:hypothetical protein
MTLYTVTEIGVKAKGENLTNIIGKNSYERLGRLGKRVYLINLSSTISR